jgi:cytochrome c-type biogenesis protein CcmH
MRLALLAAVVAALAAPAVVWASEERPTLAELEAEVVCPTCKTTLDQSDAPVADQLRRFIAARIAAGDTKSEIKARLVADFGEQVLAAPPRRGFNLLAWWVPVAGLLAGAVAVGALAWRWSRVREPERGVAAAAAPPDPSRNGHAPLDAELERRLDDALARYDG